MSDYGQSPVRLDRAGYLLGFALGGFFDGILLHQILQWHHLLSALEGEAFRDIRVQILADGLFHMLMYVVAAAGLWLLWRARSASQSAGRRLVAAVLIGFGAWHLADALLAHWLTGIHRIRMDSANPLLWDLAWLALFGLVPLAVGFHLRRKVPPGGAQHGTAAAALLALAVVGAGAAAARPPAGIDQVMVYFGPGAGADRALQAAAALDARVVWSDRSGELWAFALADPRDAAAFYPHGAWFVGSTLFPAACLSFARAGPA